MSFSAAVNAHNGLYGLQRFSAAPDLALQVTQHLRTQRGALNVKRFEEGYLLSWVLRFCQQHCEGQLAEIDLRWPLDILIQRVSSADDSIALKLPQFCMRSREFGCSGNAFALWSLCITCATHPCSYRNYLMANWPRHVLWTQR